MTTSMGTAVVTGASRDMGAVHADRLAQPATNVAALTRPTMRWPRNLPYA